ncbi:MAG: sirohydrochlorin cobaltochelatase [Oscillospiraceae bacterium]|jgi:sirohydrochlorin cobaltochelatase|nr:sirohydrochlorin cobaltochelatase [Oscillospiraceae bacterium]
MKNLLPLALAALLILSLIPAASIAETAAPKVILVVSFGTSYNDSREATIGAIESGMQAAFPDYEVRRAFTSQTIINKLATRDGLTIDNVDEALKRLAADGVEELVIQPTHVMNGFEYEEMLAAVAPYEGEFDSLKIGKPLLTSAEDYLRVVDAIAAELPETDDDTAIVFMGHGTHHYANATYGMLDYVFKDKGYANVFVGTVESYPDVETVLRHVDSYGASKAILLPLMIVAGDHANNDMAGDEEGSWKIEFKGEGYEVECVLKGLGEYAGVQALFAEHAAAAISGEDGEE